MGAADAILLGALNMGEYAYDFTGQNAHDGPSRNPHDLEHMTGGSSGGSGAAVAGGLVPIALGSDTNGSIRVPSSFCGLFGLKPTYGRLSRAGTFPFVSSLDHLGPLARTVADLALSYDAMLGQDDADPAQANVRSSPQLPRSKPAPRDFASPGSAAISCVRRSQAPFRRSTRSPARSGPIASSSSPTLNARARPPISSPWSRAPRFTWSACARAQEISIPTFAIGSSPARCCPAPGSCRRRNSAAAFAPRRSRCFATSTSCWRRRHPVARPGSAKRPWRSTAKKCWCGRISDSSPNRFRSSACRWSRSRSGPMAKSCRSACRSSRRRGAKTWCYASLAPSSERACVRAPVATPTS